MKLLVCISKVPDTTTKVAFTDNNTKFNSANVQWIINPYDEWYALVRALELKEKLNGSVTVILVGKADGEAVIRKALAIGADDAVRIDAEAKDSYFVAAQIAAYARDKNYDIILCGKETIDYNSAEVPGLIAGLLNFPFVSLASKLDVNGNEATLERDITGGKEIVSVKTPFVLSASKGMAEARIPNMRGIMAARTKPLTIVPAAAIDPLVTITHYEMPEAKSGVKLISPDEPEKLVALLHTEAKVI
jgi:electron transfer flavoprotein beta subunit